MIINKKCPKCGNESFSKGEIIRLGAGQGIVFKPDGFNLWLTNLVTLFKADVCLKCGNIETYLDNKGLANLTDIEEKMKNK